MAPAKTENTEAIAGQEPIAITEAIQAPAGTLAPFVVLAYLACAFIWGTTWFAIRVCIEPGGYPSFVAAALRFTLSSSVLAILWIIFQKRINQLDKRKLGWIALAGLLSGLAYGGLYLAEERITGGLAAVISATGPLIAAMIALYSGTEKSSKANLFGSVIALAGIALVFHDRLQVSTAQAWAVGILTVVAFLNSTSNVVMKHHANTTAAVASNAVFFGSASIMLWCLSAASGHCTMPLPLPAGPTAALLYLTIMGTLIAFACFFYLLKHVRLSTAMTLAFVTPMIALVVDAFLEKHATLSLESYLGIAVVLVGVALSVLRKKAA
jgi:drug/metabolite transporter (DMT)-like permease